MKSLKQHITEGRPSQRHPLEGHEYHKKTDAELTYIAKDAHKAAEAMKSHNTAAENKYRDQANDSATVRYFRQKNGMPDWYKKKYGHVKEEVEQVDEAKLVGILRHAEHGKAYIWQKPGEGGYNYEVEHTKSKKKEQHNKSHEDVVADLKSRGYKMNEEVNEDWQDVNRKDKTDGLSQAAVNAYRRENPGSKLKTAVTEKKPTGKRAKRRLSFCRRMGGMKKKLTSAKTSRDPDSRINKALRRWNC